MKRKSQIYFTFLGMALFLFGFAAVLTPHADGDVGLGLLRFIVLGSAAASAVAAWATAVAIVSVHKVTWPLYVTVTLVVLASVAFFLSPVAVTRNGDGWGREDGSLSPAGDNDVHCA